VFVLGGMLGIFPAATAAFRALVHSGGTALGSGRARGNAADHSDRIGLNKEEIKS